ncbi:MAG: Signal peptidase I [Candidatus Ordinivivax streblomastigis]|uniref:Signal peptidase I n=1 Tax=Candidatus Ordinivivax streblomastigis TaxID=2540710 RepID=A0A5M8P2H4_9BACT|nr:MAG: Signal peptidase I [Candidatus Ordinivivax streblomastigis]
MTNTRKSIKERISTATKSQWLRFALVSILYILFTIWDNNYWLLFGLLLIFDIYISKVIPWDGWKNSQIRSLRKIAEWADAIVFALIAVYFINIFIFQNYKIPTSSLEKTLLVGDYLFVSKVNYGPRVPNTPLSFPLTHHTLPIVNTKSYSDWPHWPYKRLEGLSHVKRGDIVVFNYPTGDTVALKVQNPDYYDLITHWTTRERVHSDETTFGKVVYRPVDRRENYVKRCIGMPGDSLQIVDNLTYINGNSFATPGKAQFNYFVETSGNFFTEKQFRKLDVSKDDQQLYNRSSDAETVFEMFGIEPNANGTYNPVYRLPLTAKVVQFLKNSGWLKSIHIEPEMFGGETYPYGYNTGWSRDNFGPLWIPKQGETIVLNEENLAFYSRCIVNYEGNTLHQSGNQIFINGVPANSYTFRQNYYFMMGDNRHNSADSRYWGFVPEDHIVGTPLLIWLSLDKDRSWLDGKIRWSRIFTRVSAQ